MATPGELTKALAEAVGLPEATITVHDRHLRAAGLRSKHGRGRGAAKVTARDAAHLLVALLGSGEIKDAAQTVRRYAETRPQHRASSAKIYGGTGIVELAALPREHSFIDAVEAIIASAAKGSLAELLAAEAKSVRGRKADVAPLIDIAALTPGTAGDIRIAGVAGGVTASVRYALPSPWDGRRRTPPKADIEVWEARLREQRPDTDLEQYRRISARTILRVAAVLAPGKEKAE
jgi:hypothetical protein